jgi:two-component system, OmpR family, sensor histidine kinase KdpD
VTTFVITELVFGIPAEAIISELPNDRLDRLFRLAQELLGMEPEMALGERLLRHFEGVFGTRAVCIFEAETETLDTVGSSRSHLAECTLAACIQRQDSDNPVSQVSVRVLRVGGKMTGSIGFEGLEQPELTADPLASLAAIAQEHARGFQRAIKSAAEAQADLYRLAILDALTHEFKNPLAIILVAAGGIRETGPLRAEQSEMTETLEAEADRLGILTARMLSVARLDREEVRPQKEVIDATSVVAEVVDQYKRQPSDRLFDFAPEFARSPEPLQALADPELLRLTLSQLLDNACKYSLPGSEIAIAMDSQGGRILIRVTNSGSFIPESEQQRIFERFYRGEQARQFTTGSGLGLYVARKIALAHGGDLVLEVEPGEAVTFCLSLPKAPSDVEIQLM